MDQFLEIVYKAWGFISEESKVFVDPILGLDPLWVIAGLLLLIWMRLGGVKRHARNSARHMQGMRKSGLFGGGSG